jgi:ATP-binding protein involved in chromosome partitioning
MWAERGLFSRQAMKEKHMAKFSQSDIRAALAQIPDPAGDGDIITTARVQGLVLRETNVGFSLDVAGLPEDAIADLKAAAEAAAQSVGGVTSVTCVLTAHNDAPAAQKSGDTPPPNRDVPAVFAKIDNVIAVASGKGGVGKSTVAVNLAAALHAQGLRVGVLDADIYGPSLPQLFNVTERPATTPEKKLIPVECHGLHTMSIGYMVPPEQAMIWRGPMVQSALIQMLDDVAWPQLDVLVLDMPPGTGDIQLTTAQRIPVDGAVIVSTPSALAQADVARATAMFEKTNVRVLGRVENMAFMTAPDGTQMHPFGKPGAEALMSLPLDTAVHTAAETGVPVVIDTPQSPVAHAFGELAKKLTALLEGNKT